MSEQDRLADIKTRRGSIPEEPLEIVDTGYEEYYLQWLAIEYGERDGLGYRDWFALTSKADPAYAEFIAHAPADVDWLVGECERLQRYEAMWQDCRRHRDKAEQRARRLQGIVTQVEKLVAPDEDDSL
jgi:hypothetical protein